MNTLAAWIKEHPGVNVLVFERKYGKSFGFGRFEEVCGFCLASHFFDREPPVTCRFCRAPLQETHVISNLPEVTNRVYRVGQFFDVSIQPMPKRPFLLRRDPDRKP